MSSNVESQMAAGDILLGIETLSTKVDPETSTPKTDKATSNDDDSVAAIDARSISSMFTRGSTKESKQHKTNSKHELKEEYKQNLQRKAHNYFRDDTYDMSNERTGYALIINNENFHPRLRMNKRSGTTVDGQNLARILKKLGFEVLYLSDGTLHDTRKCVKEMARKTDHSESNCFVMAIFSHGEDGCIYTTDGSMEIKDIIDEFRPENCPSLLEKPKIFIFQACRGSDHEIGLEPTTQPSGDVTDSSTTIIEEVHGDRIIYVDKGTIPTIPSGADFLFCYSVAEGFYSHRDTLFGSWYIQDFTKAVEELILDRPDDEKKVEFLEVLTTVNRMVSRRSVERTYRLTSVGKKQMPCFHSLLTKKLYFN